MLIINAFFIYFCGNSDAFFYSGLIDKWSVQNKIFFIYYFILFIKLPLSVSLSLSQGRVIEAFIDMFLRRNVSVSI